MSPRKTVLVVEDEPHVLAFVAMVLEEEGYRVETATNGCEALDKASAQAPDAILLDLIMPVLDGAGFLRACRANPLVQGVPVIVMSALGTHDHAETLGAQGLLFKPFDYDVLLAMLAGVL